jgi:prolyl oligopeptidase
VLKQERTSARLSVAALRATNGRLLRKGSLLRSISACASTALSVGVLSLIPAAGHAIDPPPLAPIKPVTDQYFGTDVVDNYRYLENLQDPEVQTWMRRQADHTRSILDGLPGRTTLLQRIKSLNEVDTFRADYVRRGRRYFYTLIEPGAELAKFYYRDGLQGKEHLLLDPAVLGKGTTSHFSFDYYMPSWDGRWVAYGLSTGGSEQSVLHVMEVETGKNLDESIDRTSGSRISWRADNQSFFYLRYAKPTAGMSPGQTLYNGRTYLHTLNLRRNGDGDAAVFGRGVAKNVEVPEGQGTYIVVAPGSPYAIAVANHNMDENPSTLYIAPVSGVINGAVPWQKIADVADGITQFQLSKHTLYFLSQKDASRFRLLSMSLMHPSLARAEVIRPEGHAVMTGFALDRGGLFLSERDGAVSRLLRVSTDGKQSRQLPLPFDGAIHALIIDQRESGVLFSIQSWIRSPLRLYYDSASDALSDSEQIPASKVDFSSAETKEVFALSNDGTRIPLSIIFKKGIKLDGTHPTILYGYGSYGDSLEPYFDPTALAWIERGGVLAFAQVRGGGEYGEEWHRAGQKLQKRNSILDFIACGQYLIDQGFTSPKYLAAEGVSAGGIVAGGALTSRPDLFSVILDEVGLSDALRFETEPNGPPNVSEFGSIKTEEGFHGLYAMSAYHHIRDGVAYPAVMFSTGANDPRVAPWHMTKMAARLRAATTSGRPVLLRVDYDAGHGIGSTTSQYENERADLWSFALWQMGEKGFQPLAER